MADKFKTLEYNFDETNFPAKYEAKGFKLNGELIPNKGDDSAEEMLWFYAASKNRKCLFLQNLSFPLPKNILLLSSFQ